MSHQDSVSADLLQFIKDWWNSHILETDMRYRSFLAERDVQ